MCQICVVHNKCTVYTLVDSAVGLDWIDDVEKATSLIWEVVTIFFPYFSTVHIRELIESRKEKKNYLMFTNART